MIDRFRELYGGAEEVRVYRAPGRVNLIGEHTDYNLGFVLPMALQLATSVATSPAPDGKLRIYSEDRDELREWDAAEIGSLRREGHWSDYAIGVAQELLRLDFEIRPANLLVRSTVPEGSGLSSSAALEVACALAFLDGRPLPGLEIALLCQRAEIGFVGMPCGIMDQYVSVFGRQNSAVEIDCRSITHRYVELPEDAVFVAVNSMVKHALASSAYSERVRECAAAVKVIAQSYPEVKSLRDVSPEQLESIAAGLPDAIFRRARHVVTENARVEAFIEASERNDRDEMGRLFAASHRSLQNDYEVSAPELDFLVDAALKMDGVYGARMTGGGFGGCTVNMLRPEAESRFCSDIARVYERQFHISPGIYRCKPSPGAAELRILRQTEA